MVIDLVSAARWLVAFLAWLERERGSLQLFGNVSERLFRNNTRRKMRGLALHTRASYAWLIFRYGRGNNDTKGTIWKDSPASSTRSWGTRRKASIGQITFTFFVRLPQALFLLIANFQRHRFSTNSPRYRFSENITLFVENITGWKRCSSFSWSNYFRRKKDQGYHM